MSSVDQKNNRFSDAASEKSDFVAYPRQSRPDRANNSHLRV